MKVYDISTWYGSEIIAPTYDDAVAQLVAYIRTHKLTINRLPKIFEDCWPSFAYDEICTADLWAQYRQEHPAYDITFARFVVLYNVDVPSTWLAYHL